MKKNVKHLRLSRETLRNLQPQALGRVLGRGDTHEILTGCACTDTCDTDTCTSGSGSDPYSNSLQGWSCCPGC